MRAFLQSKLWRDKAVEQLEEMGSVIHWKRLEDSDYDHHLRLKLQEESREVFQATSSEALMEELADVLEVIELICEVNNISLDHVRTIQLKKNMVRGGFKERKFVTVAEHPTNSFGEQYCLANPEKYPEVSQLSIGELEETIIKEKL